MSKWAATNFFYNIPKSAPQDLQELHPLEFKYLPAVMTPANIGIRGPKFNSWLDFNLTLCVLT